MGKYGFIYLTTNLKNNKKYIGKKEIDNRGRWKNYLGSGTLLKKDIELYGKDNFKREILEYANSLEELNELELKYMYKYNAVEDDMFYNIKYTNFGGYKSVGKENYFYGKHLNGELNPMYGKKRPDVAGLNNPIHRPEVREKFKKDVWGKQKGKKRPCISGEKHPLYGIGHTEESKRKMSKSKTMKPNARSKKVRCITTGKEFDFKKQAAVYYGLDDSSLNKHLKGINKYCGKLEDGTKLVWEYIDA